MITTGRMAATALLSTLALTPTFAFAGDCDEARAIWTDVKDTTSIGVMETYALAYKNCPIYAGLAEEALYNLGYGDSAADSQTSTASTNGLRSLDSPFTEVEENCLRYAAAPSQLDDRLGVAYKSIPVERALLHCAAVVLQDEAHPEAVAAYARVLAKDKQYTEALEVAEWAAQGGSGMAMNLIGVRHMEGDVIPQNKTKAIEWFRKASDAGFPMATSNLADKYLHGNGISQDIDLAVSLYEDAGNAGYASAWRTLGQAYRKGNIVEQDIFTAMDYFERGAELDDASSIATMGYILESGESGYFKDESLAVQAYFAALDIDPDMGWVLHNLGSMVYHGRGVDPDRNGAKMLWEMAAMEGHVQAQRKYGRLLHEDGDTEGAYDMYRRAAAQGDDTAKRLMEEMKGN